MASFIFALIVLGVVLLASNQRIQADLPPVVVIEVRQPEPVGFGCGPSFLVVLFVLVMLALCWPVS